MNETGRPPTSVDPAWLDELGEFLRIPSVSADPAHGADVAAAARWTRDFVAAVGEAELAADGRFVVGEIPASRRAGAPTVLVYGHYDVQPPEPLDEWSTPPFEPTVTGEWLVARGVADDKGQLYMLLKGAALLADAHALPVDVRVVCDGDEEVGGDAAASFVATDEGAADAAVIFDADMLARGTPAFRLAARGICFFHVAVRTADADLHSGFYGGAALSAADVLALIVERLRARDGLAPEELRVGVERPPDAERALWSDLPPGDGLLRAAGARPADRAAAAQFYERVWSEPSVDVHGLESGSVGLAKAIIPASARANVSVRLAPGQDPRAVATAFEELVRDAAPSGADVTVELRGWTSPASTPADAEAIHLGLDAFERTLGVRPVLARMGGSIPVFTALARRSVPVILTGFALPDSNVHAPGERLLLESLPQGIAAAQEVFRQLARLPSSKGPRRHTK